MLEKYKEIYDAELSRYDLSLEFDVLNSSEVRAFVYEICKNCLEQEGKGLHQKESMMTDTERLNFILNYFVTDDIGDETYVPGVCIDHERLEEDLTWGVEENGQRQSHYKNWDEDLRSIIDKAIESHDKKLHLSSRGF